jgi:hypothetical protein
VILEAGMTRQHTPSPLLTVVTILAALMMFGGSTPIAAQSSTGWVIRSSESADLWFHSVALTGFDAFGAVSLYQPGYAAQVRFAREQAGKGPTRLERGAGDFKSAFAADRDFEVVHFVPLYFAAADVDQMLDALDAVARDGDRAVVEEPAVARFGTAAVASVLTTPQQRATLALFVAAVRDEWTTAYRAERAAQSAERNAALQAASRTWAEHTAPALASVLTAQSLDGGIILASPALGPEGRFFAGRPADRTDNLVAVRLALSPSAAGDPAWLAVREMSFPSAREALAAGGALPSEPEPAEAATGCAAARLGAARLAPHGATVLDAYLSALVRVLGQPVPASQEALEAAFRAAYPMTASGAAALNIGVY